MIVESVSMSVTRLHSASVKTAERIEVWGKNALGPNNIVLDGGPDPPPPPTARGGVFDTGLPNCGEPRRRWRRCAFPSRFNQTDKLGSWPPVFQVLHVVSEQEVLQPFQEKTDLLGVFHEPFRTEDENRNITQKYNYYALLITILLPLLCHILNITARCSVLKHFVHRVPIF